MTPEAKKRKNQKKKLKQRQKKAAEKAASHSEEPLESPESTISISFNNGSANQAESDMTSKSDDLPVSSSTNISPANDAQLEISDTQKLRNELLDESDQHDITADSGDLPKNSMVECDSFITQTNSTVSQEDKKNAPDLSSSESSLDVVAAELHDNNEHAQKAAVSAVKEDSSSEKEGENYDSVIISSSNDDTHPRYNHSLSSDVSLLSPEMPSSGTPTYNISLETTGNEIQDDKDCNDKDISLNTSDEPSGELSNEEDEGLKLETNVSTEERKQDIADQDSTNKLFALSTEPSENLTRSFDNDTSKLFQDDEGNQKLPWEEDAKEDFHNENINDTKKPAENPKERGEVYARNEVSNKSDNFIINADKRSQSEEISEDIFQEHNKGGVEGQKYCTEKNIENESQELAGERDHKLLSSAEVDIIEPRKVIPDETENLFAQSSEELGEVLPWESGNKITDLASEGQEKHEDLFVASENNEKLPWEVSEGALSSGKTENSMQDSTEKITEQKFSFLEEDDDLLDDDDSFLASSEEEDTTPNTDNTTNLTSKPVEERKASRYEPIIDQKTGMRQEQVQFTNTAGIVTPQQIHGLAKSVLNTPSQQVSAPNMVSPKPPVVKDSRSIFKINEEKKKSDAYDFPLEIISESSQKGHAKPVAVPTQRFGSANSFSSLEKPIPQSRKGSNNSSRPPVIPLGTQMPRSSRTNSAVSQSPVNYAFPNPYKVQQLQQPSVQPGVLLPNTNIPPPALKVETATSVPPIRARGISNASVGSASSLGARRPTQYGLNNGPPPVSPYGQAAINLPTANKYAPVSPTIQQKQYPSVSQSLGTPAANTPNFVKTHRGHTSSISSYTPNQNEHASRYAPNNQQSYQVPHAPQPVAPITGNPNYPNYSNQPRNSYAAPMMPQAQTAVSVQPPTNIQASAGILPLVTLHAPTNLQPHANNIMPANLPPLANLPLPQNILPESITHQAKSSVAPPQRENNEMQIDNEALLHRQFPIFHWSPASKVVYAVPSAPAQSHYMISSNNVQEIKVTPIDQMIKPNDMLKCFPGPLSSAKLKKKDLIKWMETTIKAISTNDPSADMTIWQLLKIKLTDKVSWEDISKLLYNADELLMYLSQPFPNADMVPNAYRLEVNCQMRVLAFLQTGNHDEALRLALNKRDYAIALLIGSLMGKDRWSEVIQEYLYEEFTGGPNDQKVLAHFLLLIFQVFVGNSKMAIKNFYANKETSQWASENWKSIVAAVLINIPENNEDPLSIPPVVLEFLIEFGIFLTKRGLTAAASTLFIIGNVPLSNEPVITDSDVIFESIGNMNTFESVLWDEIYEYVFSNDSKFKGFSSILPQKVYHASLLQEQGLTSLGTKYTDYLGSSIRKLPKKDALTMNLTRELSEVVSRLSESNTGWLAKPKLSSVWGQLDKSFNKYIGGDDIDALSKKDDKKKVFDGFTPGSSANSSTVDLTQTFTPFQAQVTSQSYVDTTALLHNAHNAPSHSVLHSKPSHVSKGLVEANLPYTHRIGDSLQGSPQRIHNTQHATVEPQMASLRRVRTDQHTSEKALKSQQILDKKSTAYTPQFGQNHSIPMEKSNSNVPPLFADFAAPPKLGTVPSNYVSSPDLVRRESIISTGSDFLPPPKIGVSAKTNSSQGSLMYSPSVEALPIGPVVPPSHDKEYNDSGNKYPQKNTLEHDCHMSENNSNTDQNTLKDSANVTDGTMDIEEPGFNDGKNPVTMEANHHPAPPVNPPQTVGSDVQPILESNEDVQSNDALETENSLLSNGNGENGEEQPENISKPTPSAYLPPSDGVLLENKSLTQDENSIPEIVPSTHLPSAEKVSIGNKPISQKQDVPGNVDMKVLKPVEQHMSPPTPRSTDATKMHYSPYMPQAAAASANGDMPTILKTSPAIFARSPQTHASTPSPYFPLANKTNETSPFALSESMSQSQSNGDASENRFSPIKKAEVVEKDTFEPTIRKAATNQYRAFKPLESDVDKYNDVIEDESDDDNVSSDEAKKRKEENMNVNMKNESKSSNKDMDDKSNGWFGWLKKDTSDKKVYKAKLGHKNTLYYDEKLKRWVNKDATEEEKQKIIETSAPPPPPIVKRKDGGPKTKPRSGPINNSMPPINATSVIPNNPITGEPLPIKTSPSSAGPHPDNSPSPSSPIPRASGINLTGKKANGLDDLLSLAGGPKPASTRRKKKTARGYVNVMDNIQ
ncbi:COPII coat assembly protein SEC16 [Saccharomyces paradoxus]|uniref:Protein transport protein sec16 n=1 Tax=Saccharomyces paradoxus TaxID=27291 RepID=A0A8B8V134_SACPA|nr:Sec16 [Saccharomyces paradoxus]QHS76649.1 Sec16 [Saccharomyces paradoxus]